MFQDVGALAAVGAWRYGQGIYRFHPTVYNALLTTPITGEIPCEVFYRLPEWCPYIETPGFEHEGMKIHGFFVHLEWDANSARHELRLLVDEENGLLPIPLHLGKWSLMEALSRMIKEANFQRTTHGVAPFEVGTSILPKMTAVLAPLVSLTLYLCAERPEYKGNGPQKSGPKRTKKGMRLFPAPGPVFWNVADKTGEAIEKAKRKNPEAKGTHVSPKTHIRRAHWHGFWTGPRSGSASARRFELRWLPPILVNPENKEASDWRDATGSATSTPSPNR